MDHDAGDTIYYSGSNSKDNKDPVTPVISTKTKALLSSTRPIRVIRSSRSEWKYAPTIGFRYDGLYRLVEQQLRSNDYGGAYIRVKLERESGQPPYDRTRPTRAEQKAFERIQDYY
jgi:hypothetical protein